MRRGFGVALMVMSASACRPAGDVSGANPQMAETARLKGVEAANNDDQEGALAAFSEAIRLAPTLPSAYQSRGYTRYKLDDCPGAEEDFATAIQLGGKQAAWPLSLRARLRYDAGDTPRALEDADAAVRLMPTDHLLLVQRASIRFYSGDKEGALKDLEEAERVRSSNGLAAEQKRPGKGLAVGYQGYILSFGDDREGAVRLLRKAVELDPVEGVQPAVWLFGLTGDLSEVKKCRPPRPWQRALAQFARGEISDDELLRIAASTKAPRDRLFRTVEARVLLGVIAERTGDKAAAIAHYRTAIEFGAKNGDTLWAQRRLLELAPKR